MIDTQTPTDPGPPPPRAPGAGDRFFAWVAGFGVVREQGWLAGVCAGIAARLRIDVAIVRGIVVVAAVLGFPMLLLYAIAWALLPDTSGRIHLRELIRGRFDPALVGIGILAFVSVFPVVPWLGAFLMPSWLYPGWAGWSPVGLLVALLVLALIAGIVYLILRLTHRIPTPGAAPSTPRWASADVGDPGTVAAPVREGAPTDSSAEPPLPDPGLEPLSPERGAGDAEIAAWRVRHDQWRAQRDAWRRQQQDLGLAAREEARRERDAAAAAFAAAADERRRLERASNPRTSAAFVGAALGAATIVGTVTAVSSTGGAAELFPGASGSAIVGRGAFTSAIGLFAAALVVAIAMVVAGAARRRSGFLAFVTIALLVGGVACGGTQLVAAQGDSWGIHVSNATAERTPIHQLVGWLGITVQPTDDADPAPIVVHKAAGSTWIEVRPGVELILEATVRSANVSVLRFDDEGFAHADDLGPGADGVVRATLSTAGVEVRSRQRVVLDQTTGTIAITVTSPSGYGGDVIPTPSPTATPAADGVRFQESS